MKNKTLILGFSIIAVLLVVAAVSVFHRRKVEEELAASIASSIAEAESLAAEEAAAASSVPDIPDLAISSDEALIQTVRDYFGYRLHADTSGIEKLFGRRDTSPDEALEAKLRAQASWIQDFTDIVVYEAPGIEDGEIFAVATYVIDFRRTDEPAPGIMYFFAKKTSNGAFVIEENPAREKLLYAESILGTDFAASLIEETNLSLSDALRNNSTLALIYVSFQNGDIYEDTDVDISREQEVDIVPNPKDSVLLSEEELQRVEAEAIEAASREAAEAMGDIYYTEAGD